MISHMRTARSLWARFEDAAKQCGASIALDFDAGTVSFNQLRAGALRAAAWLSAMDVSAGDVVALQLRKCAATYALMLGCLRLGAVYSPLDPANPPDRTARMIERLQPRALITCVDAGNPFGRVARLEPDAVCLDLDWPEPWSGPLPPADGLHPAYVMFTSGSTGEPKGAVIPQQGVASLMRWARAEIGPAVGKRHTALNPLHFDNSVFDFYCGLVAGATLVVVETNGTRPDQWMSRIAAGSAAVMFAVPTLLMMLDGVGGLSPRRLPSVETILFGGEGFPIDHLRSLQAQFEGKTRLINVYGPTETSCICSSKEVTAKALDMAGRGFVSLGRLHGEFAHAILDDEGVPVARGEMGELWIGGGNVGLGYFRNAEETGRRFRQDPRQDAFRAIYYRSGDLVREDDDGQLWFLGRKDNQIKIGGHRVELEEIDHAAEQFAGLRRALTVVVGTGAAAHLVTMFEAGHRIALDDLARHFERALPHYMRPTRLLQLDVLPTNANGKVNRLAAQALAEDQMTAIRQEQTSALEQVRAAWTQALGHERFTINDSFFDVGGTSLAMARVFAALSAQRSGALSMTDLFAHPTIRRLAGFLDGGEQTEEPAGAAQRATRQQATLIRARRRAGATS